MNLKDANKRVTEHLNAFRKTGELMEARDAANLIDRMNVLDAGSFEARQATRAAKLSLWLTVLDALDSAKDPQFNPEDVPAARVLVPSGTPMRPDFPFEAPEGIAHPEDRRKYDEAVKANAEKATHYRFQKELRQLDAELTERADEYITGAHLRSPQALKEMNAAIAAQVHDPERADHLRRLVRSR